MIYRLRFKDKAEADKELLKAANKARSIVRLGAIKKEQEVTSSPVHNGVYFESKIITPAKYDEGYHVDVLSDAEIPFNSKFIVKPTNPKHTFA